MSGILNNKTRVLDTIITLEGRRQIANANLKVEYVSFTDVGTYYRADVISGSADATQRIYMEACHLPQDQITFEADDSGRLVPFQNGDGLTVKDGQIIGYSFFASDVSVLTGSNQGMTILQGSEFASAAESLLGSSIDNFLRLQLIGSVDKLFDDDGFNAGNKNIEFVVYDDSPVPKNMTSVDVNNIESLFQDARLADVINFRFLPPINKVNDDSIDTSDVRQMASRHIGNYSQHANTTLGRLTPQQVEYELEYYEKRGYSKKILFEPTSKKNQLFGQFFEVSGDTLKKLDVIDYGKYTWLGQRKHVFFVGKIVTDDNGTHTFIHLFTLAFG